MEVRAGVAILIRDPNGRILLDKRSDNGQWGLPGGKIEFGESICEAAAREVFEETGLVVEVERLRGVYSDPRHNIVKYPDNTVQLINIVLEATTVSGALVTSVESTSLLYCDLNALPSNIMPAVRTILDDVAAGRTGLIR